MSVSITNVLVHWSMHVSEFLAGALCERATQA